MPFTEDATEFFNSDCPDSATVTGVSDTVYGYFDREYVEIGDIAGYRPVFTCSTAAVADVSVGAMVSVEDETGTFSIAQKVKIDRIETKLIMEPA